MRMNKEILIFSHESDIDGLNAVVLAKIAFDQVDYVLFPNVEILEKNFREYLASGRLKKYQKIYITDLALYEPSLTMVRESSFKEKVKVFDHHKRSLDDQMDKYSFTKIVDKDERGKRCGTDLFYEYLVKSHEINQSRALDEFVELTRLEDTWEWKQAGSFGEKAHDLAILLNILGIEDYINAIVSKLLDNPLTFELNQKEKELAKCKKEEYENILQSILSSMEYLKDENNHKFGIVFAPYEYRNELAEYIRKNNNPEDIQYLIVVAMNKGEYGQKSYRSIDEDFDVNEVAMRHGGGGHKGASAVNITKEQKEKSRSLPKKEALKYLADSRYTM